jgi:hypothetical protein
VAGRVGVRLGPAAAGCGVRGREVFENEGLAGDVELVAEARVEEAHLQGGEAQPEGAHDLAARQRVPVKVLLELKEAAAPPLARHLRQRRVEPFEEAVNDAPVAHGHREVDGRVQREDGHAYQHLLDPEARAAAEAAAEAGQLAQRR